MYIAVAVLLAVFAVIAYSVLRLGIHRSKTGINGWVTDSDLDGSGKKYVDQGNGVIVKPDLIAGNTIIEYKSGRSNNGKAWPGHILQGIAGAEAVGMTRSEIRYADGTSYTRTITAKDKNWYTETTDSMRRHLETGIAPKGTPTPRKCHVCDFGKECPESAA